MGNGIRRGGETPGCLSAGAGLEGCYEKVYKIISRAFLRVHVPSISIPGYPFQNGFSQLLAFSVEAKCVSPGFNRYHEIDMYERIYFNIGILVFICLLKKCGIKRKKISRSVLIR